MSSKRFAASSFTVALALALGLGLAQLPVRPAYAATITVNTTSDVLDAAGSCDVVTVGSLPGPDGVISLREAICAANSSPGEDTIAFNITSGCGAGGVCTIQPTSALPTLTDDGTTINGYSQPGTAEATATTLATLLIEIEGSGAGNVNGFTIISAGNSIKGLVINRFARDGVFIYGSGATGNTVSGNYIGTDASGTLDRGNAQHGVRIGIFAQNNTVGGDEARERNVISGND